MHYLKPQHLLFCCLFLIHTSVFATSERVIDSPIIKSFIDNMVVKHQFDKQELIALFSKAKKLPKVIKSINRPAEALPWHRYQKIFVKNKRIEQGVEFWKKNLSTLNRAEKKYGVPAEIIVAIIGVESRYGKHKGAYRIVDSLSTLGIDYPRRSKFFLKELENLLLLSKEEGFDALELMGSYAGAMGKPQFIASSYRHYAVDFDGDGVRDLLNNTDDAIGSVANYFRKHGWKPNKPITFPATIKGKKYTQILDKGIKPKTTISQAKEYGIAYNADLAPKNKFALIELKQKKGDKEYWIALDNFYVITRYNHSELYAMAVFQLAESIKKLKLNPA